MPLSRRCTDNFDADYDAFQRRNFAIEERLRSTCADSPSRRVGAPPAEGFAKVRHAVPMLSLAKAYTTGMSSISSTRCRRFFDRTRIRHRLHRRAEDRRAVGLRCAMSAALLCRSNARRRHVGEDITANLRTIADIPAKLTGSGWPEPSRYAARSIRPMRKSEALKQRSAAVGGRTMSTRATRRPGRCARRMHPSPPAATSNSLPMPGAIRSADPAPTQYAAVQKFKDWGFAVSPLMVRAKSVEDLVAQYRLIEEKRSSLGYDIDGVVYKVDQWSCSADGVSSPANRAGRLRINFPPSRR